MPTSTKAPKPSISDELTSIAHTLDILRRYDAHKRCKSETFNCPQCLLNRVYYDLRGFAMFIAE